MAAPAVIAFLRHAGCPFAEYTAHALREAAAEHPGVEWVAVSHAPTVATARWRDAVGGLPDVRLLVDPERIHYATWGLGRSGIGHFLGRRSLGDVARLARQGIRNRHPDGTRWQRASTLASRSPRGTASAGRRMRCCRVTAGWTAAPASCGFPSTAPWI